MSIQIYNTLSKQKEPLKTIVDGKVGLYVCGMTVYDLCHLGHAKAFIGFDVIVRYLRHRGYEVNYLRNITDIDDKIIARANENGENFLDLVERMTAAMHKDFDSLGMLRPDHEPRATQHIDDMFELITILIDKGYAYPTEEGDVYYRVKKFDGYGKLSGKVIEDLQSGVRIDVDDVKEDPLDFALWKATKPGEPSWKSPWGEGRPGWHIECSAMSTCCLGKTFDIHGGGPDLKFPHHENEIAQSEAAYDQTYANQWMHAGPLRLGKEKMSKSLGNFFTIQDIVKKYPAEAVRLFLIGTQYRTEISYGPELIEEAKTKLDRFYNALVSLDLSSANSIDDNDYQARFEASMDDDFNTPGAISVMFDLVREINKAEGDRKLGLAVKLKELGAILGLLQNDPEAYLKSGSDVDETYINSMIQARADAKANKDFARADEIRAELLEKGIELKDSREGTTWVKAN